MSKKTNASVAKPIIVLVSTCAVTGLLLGGAHELTKPTIEHNREVAAQEMYKELIPEAEGFETCENTHEGVTACMKAKGGHGYVIVAQEKGYGGPVPMAVAFDQQGKISSVKALQNNETPGLGTKVAEASFVDQFAGKEAQAMELSDVDAITGATISSKAALGSINDAIGEYQSLDDTNLTKGENDE